MSDKAKNKSQTKTSKKRTQCALDTIIRKQTQITLIRHDPSYKQLEVKTNQPSFACGNQQHGTQSVKTYNKRTQNTKKMSNTDLNDG